MAGVADSRRSSVGQIGAACRRAPDLVADHALETVGLGYGGRVCVGPGPALRSRSSPARRRRLPRAWTRATGHVKSIGHIDKLFSGRRSRGVIADQPIDVVGVEFVPDGMTEPVVAVDLIDRGSVPGLKEGSTASIRYESDSPRTAYLEGATRTFPNRNIRGAMVQGGLSLACCLACLAIAQFIGSAFKRLIARKRRVSQPPIERGSHCR